MFDLNNLLPVLINTASFASALAAISAAIIMAKFIRKFVSGILATGFKTIGAGIFVLALGIIVDVVALYIQPTQNVSSSSILLILRQALFVIGTYIIVIGTKNMGDKLEKLSKQNSG